MFKENPVEKESAAYDRDRKGRFVCLGKVNM